VSKIGRLVVRVKNRLLSEVESEGDSHLTQKAVFSLLIQPIYDCLGHTKKELWENPI